MNSISSFLSNKIEMNRARLKSNNNLKRVLTEREIDELLETDLTDPGDDFSVSEFEYKLSVVPGASLPYRPFAIS